MTAIVTITGNVGNLKGTQSLENGGKLYRFAVANNYKHQGEDRADWFNVSAFGEKQCEFLERALEQGTKVTVTGRLETFDAKDSEQRILAVNAYSIDVTSPKKEDTGF